MTLPKLQVDALVVGGGIAGMQAALDLADQGYQVALVEKQASIGGKMIALSKVFPTLDCCSCITTPKMSAVAHHANIQLLTYCEVQAIQQNGAGYVAEVLKKPRYVDEELCTGCRQCEYACPIDLPNPFDMSLGAYRRRARAVLDGGAAESRARHRPLFVVRQMRTGLPGRRDRFHADSASDRDRSTGDRAGHRLRDHARKRPSKNMAQVNCPT